MSWWDPKGFSNLASQAFKNAQKQIDKVLDIEEDAGKSIRPTEKTSEAELGGDVSTKEESNSWNSWGSWMTPSKLSGESKSANSSGQDSDASSSSWNFSPWGHHEASVANDKVKDASAASLSLSSKDHRQQVPAALRAKLSASAHKLHLLDSDKGSQVGDGRPSESEDDGKEVDKSVCKNIEQVHEQLPPSPPVEASVIVVENLTSTDIKYVDSGFKQVKDDVRGLEVSDTPELSSVMIDDKNDEMKTEGLTLSTSSAFLESLQDFAAEKQCFRNSVQADSSNTEISSNIMSIIDEGDLDVTVNVCETTCAAVDFTVCVIEKDRSLVTNSNAMQSAEATENTFTIKDSNQTTVEEGINSSNEERSCSELHADAFSVPRETLTKVSSSSGPSELISSPDSLLGACTSISQTLTDETVDVQQTFICSAFSEPILHSMTADDSAGTSMIQENNGESVTGRNTFCPKLIDTSTPAGESEADIEKGLSPETSFSFSGMLGEPKLSLGSFPSDSSTTMASSNDSSDATVVEQQLPLAGESDSCHEAESQDSLGGSSQQWLGQSVFVAFDPTVSPSTSFVRCMIEDAMGTEDPTAKHETDSGSSEEKSEGSKVDSEFEKNIYSGQESSDEIETTTSSDIEIISTPTPNGEKNIVDLSPLRFSLQKAARSQALGHQRTDSQSSSSTYSKGDGDHFSPERDSDHDRHDWHPMDDDMDNPHNPQRLLKKLAEMAEVLQARERQLMQLSKDNNDLLETNSILRSQLQQAEAAREAEMTDLNALTEEFTRRMGESERKLQAVMKEKEGLKQQLQTAEKELSKRSEDANLVVMLAERDEQIQGLLAEGEKLSKQQLQNSTIIKKLRAKEKENETLTASYKKKLEQQREELERLRAVLDTKEDLEKKQADAIRQFTQTVQAMERENGKLKADAESSEEKIRGLQTTLDNSFREIAELHKSNASQDSRAQQAALSAEMQVREELKMAMEQQAQHHAQEADTLIMQIEDLRLSLSRLEKEHSRREEILKQENFDLQMRLQEDESRSQDLTQSITLATRPLLRQIENLQATHSIQSTAWEKVERSLTDRLTEAQTLLALAQEKERTKTEQLREVTSRCTALEASNSQLRHEKAHLAAQQENNCRRIELLEERKASEVAQLELAKEKLLEEIASLRKDKVFLEQQLEVERSRLESERQRVAVAEEQIRILERERPRSRGTPSPVSVSRQESMNSSFTEHSTTPMWFNRGEEPESVHISVPGPKTSLYDSVRNTGAASLMESLQSQLKLREGEISQLQADILQLERTRESMARELVNLTNLNEELQEEVKELPRVQTQFKELDSRYNALLQMYGEKEEKVQELLLDLEDVKEMYKQQINALLK